MTTPVAVSSIGLVFFGLVLAGPAADRSPVRAEAHFLCMALLKARVGLDRINAELAKTEEELRTNARAIQEADGRLRIALETQNRVTQDAPKRDLGRARAERRKIKKAQAKLLSDRARAESSYAAVMAALVASGERGPALLPIGLVSISAGETGILKTDGRKAAAAGIAPRFLSPGDTVSSGRNSQCEILALDGRATLEIEERSAIRIEELSPREQVLVLLQGRLQAAVESPADLELQLRYRLRGPDDEMSLRLSDYRGHAGQDFARLFGPGFVMQVPGAVCSAERARFSAEVGGDGTTEILVRDGSIEVRRGIGGPGLTIERGAGVRVTKTGLRPVQSFTR